MRENIHIPSVDWLASYFKMYSFYDPDLYAIYEARVAVSLNMIQFISNKPCLFFPYLKGRNKKIEAVRVHPQLNRRDTLKWFSFEVGNRNAYQNICFDTFKLITGHAEVL